MVSPFRGSGPFRGRGPFLGRGPWAGKAPWGFNLGGVAWSPSTLFASGEQGAWYDPADLSTLWQDSAGTTAVTAVEQPVGLMLDKSGRGNHAFNTNATTVRPVLKQENGLYYLEFGGVDDWLQTASIDFSGTDKMSVFAGVRKLSDAAGGMVAELSAVANFNDGTFGFNAPGWSPVAGRYGAGIRGTVGLLFANTPADFSAPHTGVLTQAMNLGGATDGDKLAMRVNGAAQSLAFSDSTGTGNFGNYPLYIGRRGGSSVPFNGRLYSLLVLGRTATADEITSAETWVNGKTGAY